MKQLNVGSSTRNVEEELFEIIKEEWNEYKLKSGACVRVKIVVQKIFSVLDAGGTPALTGDGDPEVAVRHQIQVVASPCLTVFAWSGFANPGKQRVYLPTTPKT